MSENTYKTKKKLIGLGFASIATVSTLAIVLPIVLKKRVKVVAPAKFIEGQKFLSSQSAEHQVIVKSLESVAKKVAEEAAKDFGDQSLLRTSKATFELDREKISFDKDLGEIKLIVRMVDPSAKKPTKGKKPSIIDVIVTFKTESKGVSIKKVEYSDKNNKTFVIEIKADGTGYEDIKRKLNIDKRKGLGKTLANQGIGIKAKDLKAEIQKTKSLLKVTQKIIFDELIKLKIKGADDIASIKASDLLKDIKNNGKTKPLTFKHENLKVGVTFENKTTADDATKTLILELTIKDQASSTTATKTIVVKGFDVSKVSPTKPTPTATKTVYFIDGDTSGTNGQPFEYSSRKDAEAAVKARIKKVAKKVWVISGATGTVAEFATKEEAWEARISGVQGIPALKNNKATYCNVDVSADDTNGVDVSKKTPVSSTTQVFVYNGKIYSTEDLAKTAWLKDNLIKIAKDSTENDGEQPKNKDVVAVKALVKTGDLVADESAKIDPSVKPHDDDIKATKDLVTDDADFAQGVSDSKDPTLPAKEQDKTKVKGLVSAGDFEPTGSKILDDKTAPDKADKDVVKALVTDEKLAPAIIKQTDSTKPPHPDDIQTTKDLVTDADFAQAGPREFEASIAPEQQDIAAAKDLVTDADFAQGVSDSIDPSVKPHDDDIKAAKKLVSVGDFASAENPKIDYSLPPDPKDIGSVKGFVTSWSLASPRKARIDISKAPHATDVADVKDLVTDADFAPATSDSIDPTLPAEAQDKTKAKALVNIGDFGASQKFETLSGEFVDKADWDQKVQDAATLGDLQNLVQKLTDADSDTTAPTWTPNKPGTPAGKLAPTSYRNKADWAAEVDKNKDTLGKLQALVETLTKVDKDIKMKQWRKNVPEIRAGRYSAMKRHYKTKADWDNAVDSIKTLGALKKFHNQLQTYSTTRVPRWTPNKPATPAGKFESLQTEFANKGKWDEAVDKAATLGELQILVGKLTAAVPATQAPTWTPNKPGTPVGKLVSTSYKNKADWDQKVQDAATLGELQILVGKLTAAVPAIQAPTWTPNKPGTPAGKLVSTSYKNKAEWVTAVDNNSDSLLKLQTLTRVLGKIDSTKVLNTWKANVRNKPAGVYFALKKDYNSKAAWDNAVDQTTTLGDLKKLVKKLTAVDPNGTKPPSWTPNKPGTPAGKFESLQTEFANKGKWDKAVDKAATLGELQILVGKLTAAVPATQAPTWTPNKPGTPAGRFATLSGNFVDKGAWGKKVQEVATLDDLQKLVAEIKKLDNNVVIPTWKDNVPFVAGGKFKNLNSQYNNKAAWDNAVDKAATLGALKALYQKLKSEDSSLKEPTWSPNNAEVGNTKADVKPGDITKIDIKSASRFKDGDNWDPSWLPTGKTAYHWISSKEKSFTTFKLALIQYKKDNPNDVQETNSKKSFTYEYEGKQFKSETDAINSATIKSKKIT